VVNDTIVGSNLNVSSTNETILNGTTGLKTVRVVVMTMMVSESSETMGTNGTIVEGTRADSGTGLRVESFTSVLEGKVDLDSLTIDILDTMESVRVSIVSSNEYGTTARLDYGLFILSGKE
jgi:hypothetical protein